MTSGIAIKIHLNVNACQLKLWERVTAHLGIKEVKRELIKPAEGMFYRLTDSDYAFQWHNTQA